MILSLWFRRIAAVLVLVPVGLAAASLPKIIVAPDGKSLATLDGRAFLPLGVTYYRPGTGWAPQVWKEFDPEATRADFARMRELGINCVRVFLTYGSFLTKPDQLNLDGLAKFDQFLDIAEQAGIYVHPTGPDHWEGLPEWARADPIADDTVLTALEKFWDLFATRYAGRNVLFAYDLRNEPEVGWDNATLKTKWPVWLSAQYANPAALAKSWGSTNVLERFADAKIPEPRDAARDRALLDYQHFREELADRWTERQVIAIKRADPKALVTVGLIQWSVPAMLARVSHYSGFNPSRQAKFLDFMEVHFYPLEHGFYEYGGETEESRNLAYLDCVVNEVAKAKRPVVLAEFGWYGGGKLSIDQAKHPPASEQQQAKWCVRVVSSTRPLAVGWLNWGLYDQPEAHDVSQLTGLLTSDGRLKAWGQELSRFAARELNTPTGSASAVRPALDWDLCLTSVAAGNEFRSRYLKAFSH